MYYHKCTYIVTLCNTALCASMCINWRHQLFPSPHTVPLHQPLSTSTNTHTIKHAQNMVTTECQIRKLLSVVRLHRLHVYVCMYMHACVLRISKRKWCSAVEGLFLENSGSVHLSLSSLSRINTYTKYRHAQKHKYTYTHAHRRATSESAHFLATNTHTVFQQWMVVDLMLCIQVLS